MSDAQKTFQIAVLPGDGIGREVTAQAVKVLRAVEAAMANRRFALQEHPAGAEEYRRSGNPLPEETIAACRSADAVILGAMGLPDVRWPDGREMAPQVDLREILDLYCGLRPIRLLHPEHSPLKRASRESIDLLIVRENTEGLFSARSRVQAGSDEAQDVMRITRHNSERIARAAFRQALARRQKVTLVDKANVLPSMVFFRRVFDEVAREFPDVSTERVYVDAAALYLVQQPQRFDVIVTENMFGDILSDLAAGLIGGMGMAPSADVGQRHGVFQPSHGTAPDIAGRGIANPVAAILSVAMLLDWLCDEQTRRGARLIEAAVERVMSDPANCTPDLGGSLSTQRLGERIAAEVAK